MALGDRCERLYRRQCVCQLALIHVLKLLALELFDFIKKIFRQFIAFTRLLHFRNLIHCHSERISNLVACLFLISLKLGFYVLWELHKDQGSSRVNPVLQLTCHHEVRFMILIEQFRSVNIEYKFQATCSNYSFACARKVDLVVQLDHIVLFPFKLLSLDFNVSGLEASDTFAINLEGEHECLLLKEHVIERNLRH